jgi:hypothetical protein
MLQYPSIDGSKKAPLGKPCIAFYKYDGSNLRWEWSPKKGWNKFGTRRQMFDESTPIYNQAIPIFHEKIADELVYRVKQIDKSCQRITAFTEFFGEGSFAGSHIEDEEKQLKLFDVFLFKKGFIAPKQFVKMFGDRDYAAEVVYEGNLNKQFIMDVRESKYPGFEGVIAKGDDFMVKIKTDAYFTKLRNEFDESWINFGE